jgi:hypothetical protein
MKRDFEHQIVMILKEQGREVKTKHKKIINTMEH